MSHRSQISAILTPQEKGLFQRMRTPQRIQEFLDSLPINFEQSGEKYMSPRRVVCEKTAHCFEAALFAAAALAYHGQKPLLLDLKAVPEDEDHVVTLFKQNGYWGAISKTNHAPLRYRDPVYKSIRELALSYFHEYYDDAGVKTLRSYSVPFDLSKFPPEKWVTANEELHWLVEKLDESRHFPLVPKKNRKLIRNASKVEILQLDMPEWKENGQRSRDCSTVRQRSP